MAAKTKLLKLIKQAFIVRDQTTTPGSTTLTAAVAKGGTALTVAAIANFAANDVIRVGVGEEMELATINGAPAGNTINVMSGLSYAHIIGEVVVEMAAYDLGDISDGSCDVAVTGQAVDIPVSTRRLSLATLNGYQDLAAKCVLPGFTAYNFAHVLGLLLAEVSGAKTAASPRQIVTDGNEFSGDTNMGFVLVGTAMDGTAIAVEMWGVDMDYSGVTMQLSRGALAGLPLRAIATGGAVTTILPTFTVLTTLKAAKSDLWDALTEIGTFVDTGTNSTINGTPAKGAVTVVLTSAAGFVANDWVKFGTGDTVEFHWIESIATNTLTLRTRLLRAQANGTVARKVTATAMAGCGEDGVALTFGGSVDIVRSATRKFPVGTRPGAATASMAWGLTELSLANFAAALGIPAAEISGSRLPIGDKVGTAQIDGMYARGTTKGGSSVWVSAWGNDMDVTNVTVPFNNRGTAPAVRLTGKPSSGLQILEY